MKILPINNILNINKNHNHKPSFKAGWIDDTNSYERLDSYIDETGMHYVRNRVPYPWAEQINDVLDEKPVNNERTPQKYVFLTQKLYDEQKRAKGEILYSSSREPIMNALYNFDVEELKNALNKLDYQKRSAVTEQPFFVLGLADIPLNEKNEVFLKNVFNELDIYDANVADENGITLLEKVMNSENESFLDKIIKSAMSPFHKNLAYGSMQKYAFDNIQNPKFKEKCKSLPMFFPDILDDIKRKDLLSIDKHVHEQMTCGFCDIDYFIKAAHRLAVEYEDNLYGYYLTESDYKKSYSKMVLDVVKKHFPKEVEKHIKHIIL